ncbi:LuxR C-terminal-related transcriptional regulator [Nocardia sp. NPDC004068]|uniref:LuxR C-terminal-related transcriptional regulator n=1 Tax=Nocardia sp. NPDC004068 TaxID=3364303 RepID=UPI0036BFF2DA
MKAYRLSAVEHRETELAELAAILADPRVRLLTLTGTAGVGKTQLAREALRTSTFRDTTVLVDLGAATDRATAWTTVRAALRRECGAADTAEPDTTLAEVTSEIGGERRALLLDDCDLVAGAIARDIAALLQRCPRLLIVTTTRVPLNLDHECVFCVLPLPVGHGDEHGPGSTPAARLLLEGIDSRYRDAITFSDQLLLDEIAQVLDGVPLALRLAAATVARVGVVRTLRVIQSGGDLVSTGYADTPPRHRSMYAAVAWGMDDLDAYSTELLLRLSLCEAAVDRETVLMLGGMDAEATTTSLATLVNRSLLHYHADENGDGRYELPAPVRIWCRRTLAADRDRARRLRADHADRMAELAETIGHWIRRNGSGRPLPRAAARRARDFLGTVGDFVASGDLDRAVRMAGVLEDVWIPLGLLADAEHIVSDVLAARPLELPSAAHRRCLELLGRWALRTGRNARAVKLLAESEAAARRSGDREAELRCAAMAGEGLRRLGRRAEAEARLRIAADWTEPGFDPGAGSIPIATAILALTDHDDTAWAEVHRRALALDFDRGGASALNALAATRLSRPTLGRARQLYLSVLEHAQSRWCLPETIRAVEGCARVYALAGPEHLRTAATLALSAEHLRRRGGIPQLESPDIDHDDGEWRKMLGDKVFCEILHEISGLDPVAVIDRVRSAPDLSQDTEPLLAVLTPRQREVAELVATGLTNRMIASRLGLSEWTVVNHLRQVMIKLDCPSRLHVALVVQRESPDLADSECRIPDK